MPFDNYVSLLIKRGLFISIPQVLLSKDKDNPLDYEHLQQGDTFDGTRKFLHRRKKP